MKPVFTQHPEVGGQGEVGGDDVQHPTPQGVAGPDRVIKQYKVVPQKPGSAAEQQGQDEVLMHGDPGAGQGAKGGEYDKRKKQAQERQ